MYDLENAMNWHLIRIFKGQKGTDNALVNLQDNDYLYKVFSSNSGDTFLFVWSEQTAYAMTVLDDYEVEYILIED